MVEVGGVMWDDIVYMIFFFIDCEKFHCEVILVCVEFFSRYVKDGLFLCIMLIGVSVLMYFDMLIEVEVIVVWEKR